ncbi:Predicted NTP pyrophosphohydrolase, NUDIX family [Mucilaginibacter mallensis]|uniref:Predicted NTP pyrophosphohydrolase, NUDIX family n=1 Tax=Mucilaginibacter mallensis TaxID=652787 RepID=A0A1H1VNZ4_MUCMA|nr:MULTISPECIES: NUDIX domain-containing protein [Mucilaginibacter]MBB6137122.1 putative NUDIX family NTP pyrophosphohydrolase [Mucilaginibacter sp. X5P1]SDS86648.1 Predicted NTP pyrophosphohydrolase, NUDIX family [Mucilaginibacter mallensis]
MPKQSAGILLYRKINNILQIFLVHPGGPFFKNKDEGSWTIPKGEFLDDEEPLAAAKREFQEETGKRVDGDFISLGSIKQKSGKTVYAWAIEGDIDQETIVSNVFDLEWPPRSGKMISIPEVDRADWFDIDIAKQKINPAQVPLIERLNKL